MQDATVGAIGLLAGLASAFFLACGDIAAEPIVAFGGASHGVGGVGAAGGSGGNTGGTGGAAQGGGSDLPAVLGLCDVCDSSTACGDRDDDCLMINVAESPITGTRFCARDCTEDGRCPTGYGCNDTTSGRSQCAPQTGNCLHRLTVDPPPPLAEMREALSAELDLARAAASLAPLTIDPALDQVAQESVDELTREDVRFGKFDDECRNKPSCTAGWAAEQQVQLAEFGLAWPTTLPKAVAELRIVPGTSGTSGTSGTELTSPAYKRVGIGIVMAGDEAFFSVAYGP